MNKRHVEHIKPVDSAQVHAALVGVLTQHLPMDLNARNLDAETLWDILLYASFHQTTIESACLELGVASGTTTRNHLVAELGDSPRDLHDLEHAGCRLDQWSDCLRSGRLDRERSTSHGAGRYHSTGGRFEFVSYKSKRSTRNPSASSLGSDELIPTRGDVYVALIATRDRPR